MTGSTLRSGARAEKPWLLTRGWKETLSLSGFQAILGRCAPWLYRRLATKNYLACRSGRASAFGFHLRCGLRFDGIDFDSAHENRAVLDGDTRR